MSCDHLPPILWPPKSSSGLPVLPFLPTDAGGIRRFDYSGTIDKGGCSDRGMAVSIRRSIHRSIHRMIVVTNVCCETLLHELQATRTIVAAGVKVFMILVLGRGNSTEHLTCQFRNERFYGSTHPEIRRLCRRRY